MSLSLSVDPLSLFLVVTLAQGIFVLSVLIFRYRLKPAQHLYLFMLVVILIWFQAEFLSIRLPFGIPFQSFYVTRYGGWLILGPLFYFYARAIVGKSITSQSAILLHISPFFVFALVIPLLISDLLSFRQVNYGMLTSFDSFNDSVSFMQYVYTFVFIVQFIHSVLYVSITYALMASYEAGLKKTFSSIQAPNLRWAKTLTILLILTIASVSVFIGLFFVSRSYNRDLDYLYVIPTSLLIYVISYKLAGVSWTRALDNPRKVSKYEKSSLTNDESKLYSVQLEAFMRETKPYLDNDLRIQQLSDMMKISSHHLSQVINEQLNTTFYEYVNRYRVEEAKRLIIDQPRSSLLEIAFKAGFNNKTSFNNAFKRFASMTPTAFRNLYGRN